MLKPKERRSKHYERFHFKCDKIYFNKNMLYFFTEKTHEFVVDRESRSFLPWIATSFQFFYYNNIPHSLAGYTQTSLMF